MNLVQNICRFATVAAFVLTTRIEAAEPAKDVNADLSAQLVSAAREAYEAAVAELQAFGGKDEQVYTWSKRIMDAESAKDNSRQGRIKAAEAHLERMKDLHNLNRTMHSNSDGGKLSPLQYTKYYALEAEIILRDARQPDRK